MKQSTKVSLDFKTRLLCAKSTYDVLNQTNKLDMTSPELIYFLVDLVQMPQVDLVQWLEHVARMLHIATP